MTRTDSDVLEANTRFYQCFRSGRYAEMEHLWSSERTISVYHPGWPGIDGREEVLASWYQVMVVSEPPEIFSHNERVVRCGNTATVFCIEDLGGILATASNVFVREKDGMWRLVHHQAAPMGTIAV